MKLTDRLSLGVHGNRVQKSQRSSIAGCPRPSYIRQKNQLGDSHCEPMLFGEIGNFIGFAEFDAVIFVSSLFSSRFAFPPKRDLKI